MSLLAGFCIGFSLSAAATWAIDGPLDDRTIGVLLVAAFLAGLALAKLTYDRARA